MTPTERRPGRDRIEELIERSSLGTSDAVAMRERTPPEVAQRIAARAKEIALAPPLEDGCCARPEGYGHDGPCVWKCSGCGATGRCMACGGDGEDGSGLPDTCMECGGSGQCPQGCDEGWCQE